MEADQPIEIRPDQIDTSIPLLEYDGLWVVIDSDHHGELIFYRNMNASPNPEQFRGQAIARIHINSLEEFKSVRDQIDETIRMHETREP